jgi:hypothetical protein
VQHSSSPGPLGHVDPPLHALDAEAQQAVVGPHANPPHMRMLPLHAGGGAPVGVHWPGAKPGRLQV